MDDLRKVYKPDVTGDGPLMALCPIHGDKNPSLAIYANGVHCFGCGTSVSGPAFLEKYPPGTIVVRYQSKSRRSDAKPTYIPISMVETYHRWLMTGRFAHRKVWFHDRGLTEETLGRLKLGHSLSGFTIPVFDVLGRLRQVRYRKDDYYFPDDTGSKYWGTAGANEPVFYLPGNLFRGESVYLCEGELDAALLDQHGLAAVSTTNGARGLTPQMAAAFRPVGTVYVLYDQDAAGRAGAERVRSLVGSRARVVSWDIQLGKDVTDLLRQISLEEFKQLCQRGT